MSRSKLSVQFLSLGQAPWGGSFLEQGQVRYYKTLDAGERDPFPGHRGIFRPYIRDDLTNQLVWHGMAGADEWLEIVLPILDRRRWIWAVEHINEPQPMDDPSFRALLNLFTVRASERLHSEGFRDVGLCFGVGWPDHGHAKDFVNAFHTINHWGPHEYNAKRMGVTDPKGKREWVGRYAQTLAEVARKGFEAPEDFVIFTEYGIDLGVWTPDNPAPIPKKGWLAVNNDPAWYMRELAWADRTILRPDRRVLAAFLFAAGTGKDEEGAEWGSFEVTEDLAMNHLLPHLQGNHPDPVAWPESPIKQVWIDDLPKHPTKQFPLRDVNGIELSVIHHTGGHEWFVGDPRYHAEVCARWHRRQYKRAGVLYHFMVGSRGNIYQTQPLSRSLEHHCGKEKLSPTTVSIGMMGNFDEYPPPAEQLAGTKRLIDWLGYPIKPHKRIVITSCPGKTWPKWRATLRGDK